MARITGKIKKLAQIKLNNPDLSNKQAMLSAGYSENSAKYPAKYMHANAGFQQYANKLGLVLENLGVTDELIGQKVKEGFNATKQGYDSSELVDYKTRLDYLKYAAELKGHTTAATTVNNTQNNYNFTWSTENAPQNPAE